MKKTLCSTLLALGLSAVPLSQASEVLFDFSIEASSIIEYDNLGFNLYDFYGYETQEAFVADFPVFDFTQSNDIFGYGDFLFSVEDAYWSDSLDPAKSYDWELSFDYDYIYGYQETGKAEFADEDYGYVSFTETATLEDVLGGVLGLSPASLLGGASTDEAIIGLAAAFNGLFLDLPEGADLETASYAYYWETYVDGGFFEFAIEEEIDGLEYLYSDLWAGLRLTAMGDADMPSHVPDGGSTGVMALLGLGVLAFASSRMRRNQ